MLLTSGFVGASNFKSGLDIGSTSADDPRPGGRLAALASVVDGLDEELEVFRADPEVIAVVDLDGVAPRVDDLLVDGRPRRRVKRLDVDLAVDLVDPAVVPADSAVVEPEVARVVPADDVIVDVDGEVPGFRIPRLESA